MNIPQSIGLIPDGNRRWAKQQNLSTIRGHLAGYQRIQEFCNWCFQKKIKHIFIYGFSYENWQRSSNEVNYLMQLFTQAIKENIKKAVEQNYQFKIIGRRDKFSTKLIKLIESVEQAAAKNSAGSLNICVSYGGRQEIIDAVKKIVQQKIKIQDIDENLFNQYLYVPTISNLDLIIRTGGKQRLSNFMPWQSAYTELFFSKTLWPDFSENEFNQILKEFSQRQRNFGR